MLFEKSKGTIFFIEDGVLVKSATGATGGSRGGDHVVSSRDNTAKVLEAAWRGSIGIVWIAKVEVEVFYSVRDASDGRGAFFGIRWVVGSKGMSDG